MPIVHAHRERQLAARRRAVLLCAVLIVCVAPAAMGVWSAWPLMGLPVVLALALCGPTALALVASTVALMLALVSGSPGADGSAMFIGFLAFVGLSVVVGVRHERLQGALQRESERSMTDTLTGLPNYAFLSQALPVEIRRADRTGNPVSFVLLDLDGFKAFNDRFGHEAGNRMLVAAGQAMKATARGSDIVGRFGGEEFAVIVAGTARDAFEAAERLRRAIAEVTITVDGGLEVGVTTSAGVAERWSGEETTSLMKRADEALYAAKAQGRNRVVVASSDQLAKRRAA